MTSVALASQSILFIQSSEPTNEDGTKIDLTPQIPSAELPLLEPIISDGREWLTC